MDVFELSFYCTASLKQDKRPLTVSIRRSIIQSFCDCELLFLLAQYYFSYRMSLYADRIDILLDLILLSIERNAKNSFVETDVHYLRWFY